MATGVADTSFSDTGLTDSSLYYYVVAASDISGTSVYSVQDSVRTLPLSLPQPPAGLTLTGGNGRITLTWTAADATTGYIIQRAALSSGPFVQVGSTDTTTFLDTALTNGSTYYYTISGVNRLGERNCFHAGSVHLSP